ncbi:hypothetical protein OIU85_017091 [Salix viminalis]|uniref:Uncharacterized protein n=1 Tax=Salix viminalis TaxID=40686 RepID=A0A9Q0V7D7_SALVM|nr:hypothetical protein OIU85_017091 [Salix viminalis]
MMRYRRLESAWPGFGRGHLFDKLEEAAMKLDDLKKIQNCSSRWCEDDKLIPDSNVDENDIFKTELEHLVMGNEILQRDEEC